MNIIGIRYFKNRDKKRKRIKQLSGIVLLSREKSDRNSRGRKFVDVFTVAALFLTGGFFILIFKSKLFESLFSGILSGNQRRKKKKIKNLNLIQIPINGLSAH